MRLRWLLLAALTWSASASLLSATPPPPVLHPVFAAPIDRALINVQSQEMPAARKEQLLGRLNLLAYARDDAAFYYRRVDGEVHEGEVFPCNDPTTGQPTMPPSAPIEPGDACAGWFSRGAYETPATVVAPSGEAATARLEQARIHYARAVELEPDNLRTRLGYAYVLDRQGKVAEARRQWRVIVNVGTARFSRNQQDWSHWENRAVVWEAVDRLAHLAVSSRDRRALARLRRELDLAMRNPPPASPIVVPLADAPFEALIDQSSPVAFDFAATGDIRVRGWLGPDAAWLVWDPNRRAAIRSGFDMVGERTWGVFWTDGFEALRALDDNADGELSGAELGGLALWRDANGDGVSQAEEVRPLADHAITALITRGDHTRPGLITAPTGVRFDNGRTRLLYDWTPGINDAPVS